LQSGGRIHASSGGVINGSGMPNAATKARALGRSTPHRSLTEVATAAELGRKAISGKAI
jgi:hypothetical protein